MLMVGRINTEKNQSPSYPKGYSSPVETGAEHSPGRQGLAV